MKDKLQTIIDKHSLLSEQLADPEIFNDQKKLTTTAKEHSALEDVVNVGKEYLAVLQNIEYDKSILKGDDAELKEIAQEELIELESRKDKLESDLKILLLPRDPNDDKNLILEIRAGTGGDEAALFAADLFRVYTRYAERKNWKYASFNFLVEKVRATASRIRIYPASRICIFPSRIPGCECIEKFFKRLNHKYHNH